MSESFRISLVPLGATLALPGQASLQDALFPYGVEFPCGGQGRCKGCRIRVLNGHLPVTEDDRRLLTAAQLDQGWRLACRARVQTDLKIELAQWEAAILSDDAPFALIPKAGLGVAIDLGTTTLVAQLADLQTGNVLGVRTALNAQARHGADIMSRIDFAMGGGQEILQQLIRTQSGELIDELFAARDGERQHLSEIVIVGNTVMHHLFCGVPIEPLSHYPFEPLADGQHSFTADQLGWTCSAPVRFLPCLGGFVGSDILAGVLATGISEKDELTALIDLGTNGEIVVGNSERMLCASTAAGPAFEGARISVGMRAATGAISAVVWRDGRFDCHVLGGGNARGICGSGLVDAVAASLEIGAIQTSGRFAQSASLTLAAQVALIQKDIRELQLAKGAIAAGFRILLDQWGATASDVTRVYLAGAFGNYISRSSARRIGLLNFPPGRVEAAGNTALRGAKLALFDPRPPTDGYDELRRRIRHVSLSADERFENIFVEEMAFPDN